MESAAEVQAKLTLYRGQLAQVNQLLDLDATNAQFLGLKDDLEKVISLTESLLKQVESQSSASNGGENSQLTAQAEVANDEGEGYEESSSKPILSKPFRVGDRVEVVGGDRVYAGVITNVIHETEFRIKYYEFDSAEVTLPIASLQRILPGAYRPEEIVLGMSCQCKYATDQQYYDAVVTGLTQFGYTVTYTAYGNSEEVPLEYLRPSVAVPQSGSLTDKNKKVEKRDANGLIPIPESLKILPTDTEEVSRVVSPYFSVLTLLQTYLGEETEAEEIEGYQKSKSVDPAGVGSCASSTVVAKVCEQGSQATHRRNFLDSEEAFDVFL